MATVVPGKLIFITQPRTYGELVEQYLIKTYKSARPIELELYDGDEPLVTSIRNPYALILEWFILNPEWKNFLEFIEKYDHSHFLNGGNTLFQFPGDPDILRDEKIKEHLAETLGEAVDLAVPPIIEYRDHYGPDEIEMVKKRFAYDLEEYQYEF